LSKLVKQYNAKFRVGQGGLVEVSSDVTLDEGVEQLVLVDASAGPVDVTLPRADGSGGKRYCIKKIDSSANAVTISTSLSQTIDGSATKTLTTENETLDLISDNENYIVVVISGAEFQKSIMQTRMYNIQTPADRFSELSGGSTVNGETVEDRGRTFMTKKGRITKVILGFRNNTMNRTLIITLRKNGVDAAPLLQFTVPPANSVDQVSSVVVDFDFQDFLGWRMFDTPGGSGAAEFVLSTQVELEA